MQTFFAQYDKKTGTWQQPKHPYITLGVATEEDWNLLKAAIEKQQPMKPIEVDEREDGEAYYLAFVCPSCKTTVFAQPYRPNHCKHCGQKLEWSEEK